MIRFFKQFLPAVATLLLFTTSSFAQDDNDPGKNIPVTEKKVPKPYKILTSGKRITVQSTNSNNNLEQIMVWTSSGHRIVEQHDLNVPSYVFTINVSEKIFFMMLEMKDGSHHTQKFGVQ